jgi:branched-chain amino acid transport system ATP-binding protein
MLLKVDDIHVSYGRLVAVRGVSLEVAEGEIVCIVGPNGAGKSTTLSTIAGLLTPTKGTIAFDGRPIVSVSPEKLARLGISLVLEGRHVFNRLTVSENLQVGLSARRDHDEIRRDMDLVVAMFPILGSRWKSPAGKLSGGEQQQLVIARALMTRPRLMMIDEPALGLAPRIVDLVYRSLEELRNHQKLTLLIVEQSTERAARAANRIYVLREGRVQLVATSSELGKGADLISAYFGFGPKSRQQGARE